MRSLEPSFVLWFYSSPGQGSKLPLFKTSKKTFQNIVNSKYNAYLCSWCRNWNSWADIHSLVSTSGGGHTRSLDCCHTLDLFIFSAESSFKLYPLHLSLLSPTSLVSFPDIFKKQSRRYIYFPNVCWLWLKQKFSTQHARNFSYYINLIHWMWLSTISLE